MEYLNKIRSFLKNVNDKLIHFLKNFMNTYPNLFLATFIFYTVLIILL